MTQTTEKKPLATVMQGLMSRYQQRVPDVMSILRAMVSEGIIDDAGDIENDHIAFRTLGVPHLGIASFEKIFLHYGYQKRDYYHFEGKKLDAYWFSPPEPHYPRIFVSELRVGDLSEEARRIIHSYTREVTSDPVDHLDLDNGAEVDAFLHQPLWRTPSLADYQTLLKESEYAAWVIYNRYYLNHFTISVHNLPAGYTTVAEFNEFLENQGFKLNDSGGKIKESPDGGLLQSSTVAQMIEAEFAERRVLPEFADLPAGQIQRQHRRDGFEAGNADKIFESTYTTQTGKK